MFQINTTGNTSGAPEFTPRFLLGFVLLYLQLYMYVLQIVDCPYILFLLTIVLFFDIRILIASLWYLQTLLIGALILPDFINVHFPGFLSHQSVQFEIYVKRSANLSRTRPVISYIHAGVGILLYSIMKYCQLRHTSYRIGILEQISSFPTPGHLFFSL